MRLKNINRHFVWMNSYFRKCGYQQWCQPCFVFFLGRQRMTQGLIWAGFVNRSPACNWQLLALWPTANNLSTRPAFSNNVFIYYITHSTVIHNTVTHPFSANDLRRIHLLFRASALLYSAVQCKFLHLASCTRWWEWTAAQKSAVHRWNTFHPVLHELQSARVVSLRNTIEYCTPIKSFEPEGCLINSK